MRRDIVTHPNQIQLAPDSAIFVSEPADLEMRLRNVLASELERRIKEARCARHVADEIREEISRGDFCEGGDYNQLDIPLNNYAQKNAAVIGLALSDWAEATDRHAQDGRYER